MPDQNQIHLGIIGAGAAGLVAAREGLRQGLQVRVFEKAGECGGVWVYDPKPEDDPLGRDPASSRHASLYRSLRTNLPKDLMAFQDFPFPSAGSDPQFIHHTEVRRYLEEFASHFNLQPHIRYHSPVSRLRPLDGQRWSLELQSGDSEEFDAVVVANGHFTKPRFPPLPGMEKFSGRILHSHNYRTPEPFANQRIALLGAAASALDLAVELSGVADTVYWLAENQPDLDLAPNVIPRPAPESFTSDGVRLADGSCIENLDTFIFCTGYHYHFPFLPPGIVRIEDNWVHPLYRELIPPKHPSLAFLGLPYAIIPFPLFELQARWFVRLLAAQFTLPPTVAMLRTCRRHEQRMRATRPKRRNFHRMGEDQFLYMNTLAAECGEPPLPSWFKPLAAKIRRLRRDHPATYRDHPIYPTPTP